MKRKFTAQLGALLTALAFSLPALPAQAETRILFNVFLPPHHFIWPVYRAWGKEVESVTEGRVKVDFPAKSAAPPPKQWDAVTGGVVDGALIFNGFIQNRAVLPLVSHLPWTARGDAVATSTALWRTYEKFFREKDEHKGVQVLSLYTFIGGTYCSTTDKPIESAADLRSRKMWALPGVAADLLKNMDVSYVPGPAVKINEHVSRNVVDGYTGITYNSILQFKAANYTKSCLAFPDLINNSSFVMFMNKDKWAEISPADQKAIMAASGEKISRAVGRAVGEAEERAKKKLQNDGIQILPAPKAFIAEVQKAAKPIVADWIKKADAKGVNGQAALDFYISEVRKLERQ